MAKNGVWSIPKSNKTLALSKRPLLGDATSFRQAHDGAVVFLGIRYTSASLSNWDWIRFTEIFVDPLNIQQISAQWLFGRMKLDAERKTLKAKQPCILKPQLAHSRTGVLLSNTGCTRTNAWARKVEILHALVNA